MKADIILFLCNQEVSIPLLLENYILPLIF